MRTRPTLILLCLSASLATTSYASNAIQKLVFYKNKIGVYFTEKKLPEHNIFTLKKPNRLVVDLAHTRPLTQLSPNNTGVAQSFRYSISKGNTRLVFAYAHPFTYRFITSPAHLQLLVETQAPKKAPSVFKRNAVIVIDPGHGGKDPGASGPNGVHEKNVVLAISKDLEHDLNNMAGMHPELTRSGDYFVTLRGRLRLARKDHADVFMAIHADAYPKKEAHGASVFALSEHGATSEAARWLAHSENRAVLGGANFSDQSPEVRSVLISLSQSVTTAHSLQFGEDVKNALGHVAHLHSSKVEQAPFVVLKSPDIPSLLVETGFVSNLKEERALNSAAYQAKLAHALAKGTRQYFYTHPPRHSLIALQQRGKLTYKVKKNDSVKSLARYFNVSQKNLMTANHWNTKTTLKTGEVVHIPKSTEPS